MTKRVPLMVEPEAGEINLAVGAEQSKVKEASAVAALPTSSRAVTITE